MEYKYYCTARPAAPGAIPPGAVSIETFNCKMQFAFCAAWSIVTYAAPLDADTLRRYELSENKPPQDDFIRLDPYDPIKIFTGTEEEAAEAERISKRNNRTLLNLYKLVKRGKLDYIYTVRISGDRKSIIVLHPSAKYETGLQLTCYNETLTGDFLFMVYDCRIESESDFLREFHAGNAENWIVYHSEL